MTELSLFAEVRPKAQHFDEAMEALQGLVAPTLDEPGCANFTIHVDRNAKDRIYLFEVWESDEALEYHYAQPYTVEVFDAYQQWLAEPVRITKMTPMAT